MTIALQFKNSFGLSLYSEYGFHTAQTIPAVKDKK